MLKISALNEESSEESDEDNVPTITNEAQEQIALTEYNKALELLNDNKIEDALKIFQDLLETELLAQVEKPDLPDGRARPMLSLKYCCFKNIGAIYARVEQYDEAIDNYWAASNLDDTDVTLWCRMGMLALKTASLEFACAAFKQGLKCNPNHWPCLDNIITAMYAIPDYMNCLLYISMALERDPTYIKGLAFREDIYSKVPYLEESYKIYNIDWALDPPMDMKFDRVIGKELIAEATKIAERWIDLCKSDFELIPLPDLSLQKPIKNYTWLELGESLIHMHKYIAENNLNYISKITIKLQNSNDITIDEITNNENVEIRRENDAGMIVDISSEFECIVDSEMETTSEQTLPTENLHDQEVPEIKLEHEAEAEVDGDDDERSNSSNVQAIKDTYSLQIESSEIGQLENEVEDKLEDVVDFQSDITIENEIDNGKYPLGNLPKTNSDENTIHGHNEVINTVDAAMKEEKNEKLVENSDGKTCKSDEKVNEHLDNKGEQQKVKKRRRSSLCFLQQWAWSSSSMRRSARVRGSNRREAEREDVQLEEIIRRIFPPSLLPDTAKLIKDDPLKGMDDSMDTMDLYQLFTSREKTVNNEESKSSDSSKSQCSDVREIVQYFGTESETYDVLDFINQHSAKSNMMIIIAKFTEFLAMKWNYKWPTELKAVYLQAYLFTREHIPHSSLYGKVSDDEIILKYDAEMTLLFNELHTDHWLDNKPDILPSATIDKLATGIPSEELGFIIFASVRDEITNEENFIFLLRVLWVKANIFLCQGDTEVTLNTLELLHHHMEELKDRFPDIFVTLPNCKYNSSLTISTVRKRIISIERGLKLGEVQKLYDEQKYTELSLVLQDTFKFTKQRTEVFTNIKLNVDRIKQLSMLLDCLWKLDRYEDCYVWSEACLAETWQCYLNSTDEFDQKKWSMSVVNSLEKLEMCINMVGTSIVRYLTDTKASRFVQTLVQVVCHQLDVADTTVEMPLETVTPWIMLHHILQYEEDKERAKPKNAQKSKASDIQDSNSDDEDKDIPAPIMILFTAHTFLGRHSWCCINEAKLLYFIIKTVVPRMCGARYIVLREKISKHLEQIFWCLYGHPNRTNKTKPKHLEDHGVPQLPLTWEIAQLLFEFYKPDVLPEFDTPRAMSISADTKILFKKISSLVPREHDPSGMIDEITSYIVGDIEKIPTVKKPLPYQVESLYYLLGDYSFKNNNWLSATKYYSMDICLHSNAFNSWVALAMSESTLIGTALNNCKPLSDIKKLLSQAKVAECCYQRAVELRPGHSVIWIEYGNFVYMIHSFCSRLLKQESDTLSMEKFALLETRKENTLEIAENCFISANRIYMANIDDAPQMQDERWLYHYMLAKIAEKKNDDPPVYLEHYATASELLHKNNAHYPKRISHKSPYYLSIEALEVHYRIHASILKYLEQHEGKPLKKSLGQIFLKHLLDCANGPFMQYQSKLYKNKRKEDTITADATILTKKLNGNLPVENTAKYGTSIDKPPNVVDETLMEKCSDLSKIRVENKKRFREIMPSESSKRMKIESVSHLQLMHDVVGIMDDLITNVCEIVAQNNRRETSLHSNDEIMVISSDESDGARSQNIHGKGSEDSRTVQQPIAHFGNDVKNRNALDVMDALMKRTMEMSEALPSSQDIEDDAKFDGKWLQNDRFHGIGYINQNKERECKDKVVEKKKTQVNTVKNEATMSRRGSQESTTTTLTTTTTTTETNNSSFSSSDESSTSDDSSDSDSSSGESDSESCDSDFDKKKSNVHIVEKEEYFTDTEVAKLISYCLAGLEQCVLRFPEHYKSIYRLCHFYFNNKLAKDNDWCRDLLLGTYRCQYYAGQTFQGLFADRKNTNFFNGVWRIPNDEIDRPGSFASHMSRCVTLLMQILKETDDSRMLMELCVQLRKTPDADKKYVRDSEREQLSRQALTLCLQSLRTRVQSIGPPNALDNASLFRTDPRTRILMDVYKIYQQVQRNFQGKEVQAFATLLVDTYKVYMDIKTAEGNLLEAAMRCCQQQNLANKIAASQSQHSQNVQIPLTVTATPAVSVTQSQPSIASSQTTSHRKTCKNSGTGRPRGRPPNVNKYSQNLQQSGSIMNQLSTKRGFGNYMGAPSTQALMNPFFINSLVDQNMISAMLAAGLSGNMMDSLSTVNYFNQMGSYQEILRQYQNNLTSMNNLSVYPSNISTSLSNVNGAPAVSAANVGVNGASSSGLNNIGSMANLGNLTVQQLITLNNSTTSTPTSSSSMMYHQPSSKLIPSTNPTAKDLSHSVSITPVAAQHKSKSSKHVPSTNSDSMSTSISKPMQSSQQLNQIVQSPTPQVSLLKPSIIQQSKTTTQAHKSTTQIRVSKNLNDSQPIHNAALTLSPLKTGNASNMINLSVNATHSNLQIAGLSNQQVPMAMPPRSGTSLQHKLQQKKQVQHIISPKIPAQHSVKKHRSTPKQSLPLTSNNLHNMVNMSGTMSLAGNSAFIPPELSGLSVSAINQPINAMMSQVKYSSFRKNVNKSKPPSTERPISIKNSLSQPSPAETMDMLTQLQQHAHLEIIPQSKNPPKQNMDFSKNIPLSLSVTSQKSMDNSRPVCPDAMRAYEVPWPKTNNSPKKGDKHTKDSVEIITLDD